MSLAKGCSCGQTKNLAGLCDMDGSGLCRNVIRETPVVEEPKQKNKELDAIIDELIFEQFPNFTKFGKKYKGIKAIMYKFVDVIKTREKEQ